MEIGSKVALYKCELVTPPNNAPKFYKVTICEKVYNSKKKLGGNWETVFYPQAYIFDTSFNLEPAKFTLNVNEKDKFSFDNIENPDESLIRVLDFKFEPHSRWNGNTQVKDDYGKPIYDNIFYLTKIDKGNKKWQSENSLSNSLKKRIDEITASNIKKCDGYRLKIDSLKREIERLKRIITRKIKVADNADFKVQLAKDEVKKAHREAMVFKRKNTITENELEKTQNKLVESKQKIKEVKKMKKQEVIKKAEEFDFDFDDM